jgi:predicted nuclease with TOPRIM domain
MSEAFKGFMNPLEIMRLAGSQAPLNGGNFFDSVHNLAARYMEMEKTLEDVSDRINGLEQENAELSSEIVVLKREIYHLEQQKEELEKEVEALRG